MKCRNCKCNGFLTDDDGEQFSWCNRFGDNLDIDEERYCSGYTPATNADRIRAMTDEELAELLSNISGCDECEELHGMMMCERTPEKHCNECWLDWLKREG